MLPGVDVAFDELTLELLRGSGRGGGDRMIESGARSLDRAVGGLNGHVGQVSDVFG